MSNDAHDLPVTEPRRAIPYGRQSITDEDIRAVEEVLRSDFLTQGPRIAEFEAAFARYIGSDFAIAVSNGTAALHLAVLALGLKPGEKVITTPMTFAASANCVRYAGGEVVFCDIDPQTGLMDIDALSRILESGDDFAGIIPVDYAGLPVQMDDVALMARQQGIWVLEDACHAPGAQFVDHAGAGITSGNGTYCDAAIYSFHPVKHIACGEGGMVTTNSKELYDSISLLRTHGITKDEALMHQNDGGWYYEMQELGYNYRLSDMQAALGLSQLSRADEGLARRRAIAARYDSAFAHLPINVVGQPKPGQQHAYHLYVIRTAQRKELYDYLRQHQIFAQVHYIPVHMQPYYRELGWKAGDLPNAEAFYAECLSLPMYPTLSDADQEFVIEKINAFYA